MDEIDPEITVVVTSPAHGNITSTVLEEVPDAEAIVVVDEAAPP